VHKKIEKILRQIDNSSIHKAVLNIMTKHHERFIKDPGGCTRHHSYIGGLLDHSYDTAMLAASMADKYQRRNPKLNRSIIVAGAFLHDVGKVKCYTLDKGTESYISTQKSRWHHHIPIGFHIVATEVEDLVARGKMNEDIADHLLHIIVSHHGRVEYRSPQPPKTDEAFIVSQADLIDAFMGASKHAKRTFNKGSKYD